MRLNRKGYRILFSLIWIVYFCSYLGRLNYTAVMGELISNVIDKTQAGWVQTCFLIAYAGGQLLNGMLADKVSPRIMVAVGAIGGGLANILFAFARSFPIMAILRFADGLFMSTLWPSMVVAMVRYMTAKDKIRCSIDIASSMSVGTLLSYAAKAAILKWLNWSWSFMLPGIVLACMGIVWYLAFPRMETYAVLPDESGADTAKARAEQLPIGKLIMIPCLLVAVLPVVLHGVIKDGVTAWVPAYLCEVHNQTPAFSSLLSMLLPLFNLAGAYMAKYVYEKTNHNALTAASVFFAISFVTLGIMLAGAQSLLFPTVVCFALITSFMMAVNVLLINLLPLQFEQYGRAATVSGGLNAVAYGGSALASGLIGVISDRFRWTATVASWFGMMAIAFAVCFIFRMAKKTARL